MYLLHYLDSYDNLYSHKLSEDCSVPWYVLGTLRLEGCQLAGFSLPHICTFAT